MEKVKIVCVWQWEMYWLVFECSHCHNKEMYIYSDFNFCPNCWKEIEKENCKWKYNEEKKKYEKIIY